MKNPFRKTGRYHGASSIRLNAPESAERPITPPNAEPHTKDIAVARLTSPPSSETPMNPPVQPPPSSTRRHKAPGGRYVLHTGRNRLYRQPVPRLRTDTPVLVLTDHESRPTGMDRFIYHHIGNSTLEDHKKNPSVRPNATTAHRR